MIELPLDSILILLVADVLIVKTPAIASPAYMLEKGELKFWVILEYQSTKTGKLMILLL